MHYNGANSYLFANGTDIIKFKAKNWNCSNSIISRKHFKILNRNRNMKKTGLNGYIYNFNVDYDVIAVDVTWVQIQQSNC